MLGARNVLTTLEAEEEDSASEDVEEEGEADAEGCEEHRADGVATPDKTQVRTMLWGFGSMPMLSQLSLQNSRIISNRCEKLYFRNLQENEVFNIS